MQIGLRIPPATNAKLRMIVAKTGKTKTALILEAVNEKYNLKKTMDQLVRELSGWMSSEDCAELRDAVADNRKGV